MADEPTTAGETEGATPETETVDFWKQKSRLWESRARENSAAVKRLAELEESSKAELQKVTERAEQAEREASELKFSKLRGDIALETGIPADFVEFLTGADETALRAQAEKLASRLGAKADPEPEPAADEGPAKADPVTGPYAPREGSTPTGDTLDYDAIAKAARGH